MMKPDAAARPRYALTTQWLLASPIETVWNALAVPQGWPQWWPYLDAVVPLVQGDADSIGAVWRYTWSSRLPYRLTFDMTTTASRYPELIEGIASGELRGRGCWRLARDGSNTRVRYTWIVTTGKRWMSVLAPLLRRVFEWNHDQVMRAGGYGLARHLGVRLLAYHRLKNDEDRTCTTC
jgi:hypothetical protein